MEGFWQPGEAAPGALEERDEEGAAPVWNPNASLSLAKQRLSLPVCQHRDELLFCVSTRQVTVVVGATGSGKTTQIPQYLHEVRSAVLEDQVADFSLFFFSSLECLEDG